MLWIQRNKGGGTFEEGQEHDAGSRKRCGAAEVRSAARLSLVCREYFVEIVQRLRKGAQDILPESPGTGAYLVRPPSDAESREDVSLRTLVYGCVASGRVAVWILPLELPEYFLYALHSRAEISPRNRPKLYARDDAIQTHHRNIFRVLLLAWVGPHGVRHFGRLQ